MSSRHTNSDAGRHPYHSTSTPNRAQLYHYQAPQAPYPPPYPQSVHPQGLPFQFTPGRPQDCSLTGRFHASPGAAQYYGVSEAPFSGGTTQPSAPRQMAHLPAWGSTHLLDLSPSRRQHLERSRPPHTAQQPFNDVTSSHANSTSTLAARPDTRKRRRGQNEPAAPLGPSKRNRPSNRQGRPALPSTSTISVPPPAVYGVGPLPSTGSSSPLHSADQESRAERPPLLGSLILHEKESGVPDESGEGAGHATDVWYFVRPLETRERPERVLNDVPSKERPKTAFMGCRLCM